MFFALFGSLNKSFKISIDCPQGVNFLFNPLNWIAKYWRPVSDFSIRFESKFVVLVVEENFVSVLDIGLSHSANERFRCTSLSTLHLPAQSLR